MVGSSVSHYKILERLGQGGMGVVYKAEDTRLGRTVALKFLADQIAPGSYALERFKREARAASALNHPNICTIHDVDDHLGQPFIVMELLEGQTARDALSKGVFPFDRLVTVAVEICDALDQAHGRGVLHRDIKPANIFITTDGRSKLLDFGLAKVSPVRQWSDPALASTMGTLAGEELTVPGAVTGTVAYMSPEQAQGQRLDERADLYSLGVSLYEMATGRTAFTGPTVAVVFDAILNRQPLSVVQLRPDMNTEMDRIIMRLMSKHPSLRHQSARELHEDLRGLIQHRPSSDSGRAAARGLPSIAVLPFRNLSPDPDNEYFSDGMTEEIINALSQLPGLRVAARTSSFAFKGRTPEIAEVGAKLKVSAVLSGSVRMAGSHLRLNVELVNVGDGFPIWTDRYDREMTDVFQIQDEVATRIVEKLRVTLSGPCECLVRPPTDSFQAYELYLRGRVLLNQRVAIPRAIEYFEGALELDSKFALAFASVAEAHVLMGFYGFVPARQAMPAARKAAERALAIDPALADPHVALALIAWVYEWDWPLTRAEFDKAIAANSRLAGTYIWQSLYLACTEGKFEEAIAAGRKASELDPLSATAHTALSWVYCCAGQFKAAEDEARRALTLEPLLWTAARIVAVAQMALGKYPEAVETLEAAMTVSGRHVWIAVNLVEAYMLSGQPDSARRLFEEILERSRTRFIQPMFLGLLHAIMGQHEKAFEAYGRAVEERDGLPLINYSPVLGCAVRKDPRFIDLVRRVGMIPAPDLL